MSKKNYPSYLHIKTTIICSSMCQDGLVPRGGGVGVCGGGGICGGRLPFSEEKERGEWGKEWEGGTERRGGRRAAIGA